MKSNIGVYKITNLSIKEDGQANSKVYIGSSVNLKSRKHKHFSNLRLGKHENDHLQKSYSKYKERYGEEVDNFFLWEVLEYLPYKEDKEELREELIAREQYYIDEYLCKWDDCYNIRKVAESMLGTKRTDETKKKISDAAKGRKHTEDTKIKMRKARKGRFTSDKTRELMRKSSIGKKLTDEAKKKLSDYRKGQKHTDETKKKLSDLNKGDKNKFYGKKHTDETKKKLSELKKGIKGSKHTEATKNKMKETCKPYVEKASQVNRKKVVNLTDNKVFNSLTEAAKYYGLKTCSSISRACLIPTCKAAGCYWAYYRYKI